MTNGGGKTNGNETKAKSEAKKGTEAQPKPK